MSRQQRRALGALRWREILGRFEGAGTTVEQFCAREGVCKSSFYHWRSQLGMPIGGAGAAVPVQALRPRPAQAKGCGFIDLGRLDRAAIDSAGSVELRLDLGGGVVLQIVRR